MASAKNLPMVLPLLFITLILLACQPAANNDTPCTLAEGGAFDQDPASVPNVSTSTVLTIWAPAPGELCWRALIPLAASQMADRLPQVRAKSFSMLSSAYYEMFEQAAAQGNAPDIAYVGEEHMFRWAAQDLITPLDQCRTRYPEFSDVYPQFWSEYGWHEHLWGVPVEISLTLLYYNRQLLKDLKEKNPQLDALSRLAQGNFTLGELLDTARQAVKYGIVQPGFAFWPAARKQWTLLETYKSYGGRLMDAQSGGLVINRAALTKAYMFLHTLFAEQLTLATLAGTDRASALEQTIMNDATVHGRVLFWQESNHEWSSWANDVASELGGEAYLFDHIGYTLYPSGRHDEPGNVVQQSGFYVITAERASGRRQQEAACRLLAKTLTPDLNARHAITSAHLGVLPVQPTYSAYQRSPFIAKTTSMLQYAWRPPVQHRDYEKYMTILLKFLKQVETNQLLPDTAANQAIQALQIELADPINVE